MKTDERENKSVKRRVLDLTEQKVWYISKLIL